ncbi:hypothetical protein DFH06DRAFT_1349804 [Mycena polygramma]|nr:hypothetical protein DFH06DRAFT_1349804 [Mycena polygramma]
MHRRQLAANSPPRSHCVAPAETSAAEWQASPEPGVSALPRCPQSACGSSSRQLVNAPPPREFRRHCVRAALDTVLPACCSPPDYPGMGVPPRAQGHGEEQGGSALGFLKLTLDSHRADTAPGSGVLARAKTTHPDSRKHATDTHARLVRALHRMTGAHLQETCAVASHALTYTAVGAVRAWASAHGCSSASAHGELCGVECARQQENTSRVQPCVLEPSLVRDIQLSAFATTHAPHTSRTRETPPRTNTHHSAARTCSARAHVLALLSCQLRLDSIPTT